MVNCAGIRIPATQISRALEIFQLPPIYKECLLQVTKRASFRCENRAEFQHNILSDVTKEWFMVMIL